MRGRRLNVQCDNHTAESKKREKEGANRQEREVGG